MFSKREIEEKKEEEEKKRGKILVEGLYSKSEAKCFRKKNGEEVKGKGRWIKKSRSRESTNLMRIMQVPVLILE